MPPSDQSNKFSWKKLFFQCFAASVVTICTCTIGALFAFFAFMGKSQFDNRESITEIQTDIRHMVNHDEKLKDVLSEELIIIKKQNESQKKTIIQLLAKLEDQQDLLDILIEESKPWGPKEKPKPIPKVRDKNKYQFPLIQPFTDPKISKEELDKYRDQLEQKTQPDNLRMEQYKK